MWREQATLEWLRRMIYIIVAAATVWSFAHMPLGLSDRNNSTVFMK